MEKINRIRKLTFRLRPDEHRDLVLAARLAGKRKSDFARDAVMAEARDVIANSLPRRRRAVAG